MTVSIDADRRITVKFYKMHRTYEAGTSAGYSFFSSKHDAEKARAEWIDLGAELEHAADIERIDIEPTKAGILAALNRFGSHADNG